MSPFYARWMNWMSLSCRKLTFCTRAREGCLAHSASRGAIPVQAGMENLETSLENSLNSITSVTSTLLKTCILNYLVWSTACFIRPIGVINNFLSINKRNAVLRENSKAVVPGWVSSYYYVQLKKKIHVLDICHNQIRTLYLQSI